MSLLTFICGTENVILLLALIGFMVGKLVRKDRLTPTTWISLIVLTILCFSVSVAQIFFGGYDSRNCNFVLHMVYGVENIIMFNLLNSIGFKVYLVCHDIYEFAFHGNLPTNASKIRNKRIHYTLLVTSVILLILYVSMNTYWWFVD